jgi:hypothetical protein
MAQGEASVQHAGRGQEHGVAGNSVGVVVRHRGHPGASRLASLVEDVEVEQDAVRLPDRVGRRGAMVRSMQRRTGRDRKG